MQDLIQVVLTKSMAAQEIQEAEDFDVTSLTNEDIDQLLAERDLFLEVKRVLESEDTTEIAMYKYANRRLAVINRILLALK